VEHALGLRVGEEALGIFPARQVVVAAARDDDVVAGRLEARDEV
jgi:hypothetical protein